jgi:hypothetical protein
MRTPITPTHQPSSSEPIGMPPIMPSEYTDMMRARWDSGEASWTIARDMVMLMPPHRPQRYTTRRNRGIGNSKCSSDRMPTLMAPPIMSARPGRCTPPRRISTMMVVQVPSMLAANAPAMPAALPW